MTYHLHTETFDNLATLTAQYFEGFTVSLAKGYWQGAPEDSTTIEITTDDDARVMALARTIRATNGQQAVLVERYDTHTSMITD